jgi:pilus assembly protein CpaE
VRQSTPFVVLDMPHGWQPWLKASLLSADEIVIVATPDLTSLRNAKNIFELVRSARPNDAPPRVVINQVGMPKRPEIPAKDFAETMGVEPSSIIAFDPASFGQAANNGQMVIELAPKAPVADSLRGLCRALTGRAAPAEKNVSIFSKLLKAKKQA